MKKIEVIPRFRIDGKYYTMEELPKEKVREIVNSRIDMAMKALRFEKDKSA